MPVWESFPLYIPEDKVASQEMDLRDIQSDLHALQKLYGLLKDDGGALPNAMFDMLDDKARHMLKSLLDVATERVFTAHSEIVGSYVGESFSSQQQQNEDTVNQKFPVQANLSKVLVKRQGEDLNDLKFSSLKEEQRLSNPASQADIVKQSSISFTANGSQNRKKRCRICQRSTVKQLKSTSFFSDLPQNLERVNPPQHQTNNQDNPFFWSDELDKGLRLNNQFTEPVRNMEKKRQVGDDNTSYNLSRAGSTAFSVNRPTSCEVQSEVVPICSAETMVNVKEADSLSKEASEAIKEIESRILALQIDAENLGPPRKRAAQHGLPNMSSCFVPVTEPDRTVMQTKGGEARDTDLSHTGECVAVGNNFLLQVVNQSDHELKNSNSPIKMPTRSMNGAMEKKLPSRILALQIDAENLGPPRKRAAQHGLPNMSSCFVPVTEPDRTVMQTKGGEARDTDLSHTGECVAVGNNFLLQVVNQSDHELKNSNSPIKMPTRSMNGAMEKKLPDFMVNQLPKPFPQTHTIMSQIESQNIGSNSGFTSGCDTSSVVRKPVVKQSLQNQKLNQVPSQNVCKATVPNDQMPSHMSKVMRFGFPEESKKMSNWATALPAKFPSQMNKEYHDENQMDLNERIGKFILVDPSHKVYPTRMARGKKRLLGKLPKRAGVLDHKLIQPSSSSALYDTWVDQRQVGVLKNNKPIRPVRKVLMDNEESESITSESDSPSWTNQQISTSCNESEEYSVSGGMQSNASPSSSSESEAYSVPRRNQDRYVGATSSSENEVYSSASGSEKIYSSTSTARTRELTPTSSSESDRYSSRFQSGMHHDKGQMYSSDDSVSRRKGHAGIHHDKGQMYSSNDSVSRRKRHAGVHISTNGTTTKKQSGRLKKLKDKLAIIFHHHHHHHHHLHQGDESDHINQQANISHGKSLWKKSRKLTYPNREKETHGEQAVEKLGKSMIRDRPSKNQHRHFHELVKGVLRHIRHSKESKSSKEAIKRLERNQHGDKEAFKKSHWWQLLRHQKGVRMPKKAHAKLGFNNKRSQLKAFPKMK